MVGNLHYPLAYDPTHHADVLGKTAAAGRKTRRGADLFVDRALRKDFFAAVVTFAAGDVVEHHYAIADGEIVHAFAQRNYPAGHLMAENTGRRMRARQNFL